MNRTKPQTLFQKRKQQEKQKQDQQRQITLVVIGVIILVGCVMIPSYLGLSAWEKIIFICLGAIACVVLFLTSIKVEQISACCKCSCCNQKYTPTFMQLLLSFHIGRTRYLRCPHCGLKSWSRKIGLYDD